MRNTNTSSSVVRDRDGETGNFQLPLETSSDSSAKTCRRITWSLSDLCYEKWRHAVTCHFWLKNQSPLPFFTFALRLFPCCFGASLVTSLRLQWIYRSGSGTFTLLIKLFMCRCSTDESLHLKSCITYVRVFLFFFVVFFCFRTLIFHEDRFTTYYYYSLWIIFWILSDEWVIFFIILFYSNHSSFFQQHYCFIIWVVFTTWIYISLLEQLKTCVSCYVLWLAVNFQL